MVAVTAAALLLGGGVSYATYQQIYTPAATGDVTCLTERAVLGRLPGQRTQHGESASQPPA
ncbi:hypothetical protein [Streptosporangium sp. NPDC000509]|uniref:hypothetical protein n=1 Tax=Streptosporangium sp. NPDC000509 TaxID=3366186 RepID=UPI00368FE1F3